jgi:hypothetical protein
LWVLDRRLEDNIGLKFSENSLEVMWSKFFVNILNARMNILRLVFSGALLNYLLLGKLEQGLRFSLLCSLQAGSWTCPASYLRGSRTTIKATGS